MISFSRVPLHIDSVNNSHYTSLLLALLVLLQHLQLVTQKLVHTHCRHPLSFPVHIYLRTQDAHQVQVGDLHPIHQHKSFQGHVLTGTLLRHKREHLRFETHHLDHLGGIRVDDGFPSELGDNSVLELPTLVELAEPAGHSFESDGVVPDEISVVFRVKEGFSVHDVIDLLGWSLHVGEVSQAEYPRVAAAVDFDHVIGEVVTLNLAFTHHVVCVDSGQMRLVRDSLEVSAKTEEEKVGVDFGVVGGGGVNLEGFVRVLDYLGHLSLDDCHHLVEVLVVDLGHPVQAYLQQIQASLFLRVQLREDINESVLVCVAIKYSQMGSVFGKVFGLGVARDSVVILHGSTPELRVDPGDMSEALLDESPHQGDPRCAGPHNHNFHHQFILQNQSVNYPKKIYPNVRV